jgi:hypothetical protein
MKITERSSRRIPLEVYASVIVIGEFANVFRAPGSDIRFGAWI